jgi:hypothetical protein
MVRLWNNVVKKPENTELPSARDIRSSRSWGEGLQSIQQNS